MRDERHEKILDKKRMDERLSKYATSDTHLPPTGSQPEPLEEPQYPLMVVSGLFESERMHLEHVDPRAISICLFLMCLLSLPFHSFKC